MPRAGSAPSLRAWAAILHKLWKPRDLPQNLEASRSNPDPASLRIGGRWIFAASMAVAEVRVACSSSSSAGPSTAARDFFWDTLCEK